MGKSPGRVKTPWKKYITFRMKDEEKYITRNARNYSQYFSFPVFSSSICLGCRLNTFPGPSTESMFAFILGRNQTVDALTPSHLRLRKRLWIWRLTCWHTLSWLEYLPERSQCTVWQCGSLSNVHPRRLNVGTVYAGIFIAISTVKLDIYAPDE